MVVGLIIRLSPGHVIREMLVSPCERWSRKLLREPCSMLGLRDDPPGAGGPSDGANG